MEVESLTGEVYDSMVRPDITWQELNSRVEGAGKVKMSDTHQRYSLFGSDNYAMSFVPAKMHFKLSVQLGENLLFVEGEWDKEIMRGFNKEYEQGPDAEFLYNCSPNFGSTMSKVPITFKFEDCYLTNSNANVFCSVKMGKSFEICPEIDAQNVMPVLNFDSGDGKLQIKLRFNTQRILI
jgi:hypothetical protein